MRRGRGWDHINTVLTEPNEQHPWSKYYAKRGVVRPAAVELAPRRVVKTRPVPVKKAAEPQVSAELQAAVAAVTAQTLAPGMTAAPFISAMQKEAVAREMKRAFRVRLAKIATVAAVFLFAVHFSLTRTVFHTPFESQVRAHLKSLPEAVLAQYSSERQPMRADGVVVAQADQIDGSTMRYVAAVTLRLRKPLYIPAVTNGTMAYRRLQESLIAARDQEMRFNLFPPNLAPELPELPLLLQPTHQAGETIVVRVPFTARRFGWTWRLGTPSVALRNASRILDGDSIDRYAGTPFLIFGGPETLVEIRNRTKQANNYVVAVAKAVQRQAFVTAVVEKPVESPIQPDDATLPLEESPAGSEGFDPNAPAIEDPKARKLVGNSLSKPAFSIRNATLQERDGRRVVFSNQ